MPAPCLKHCVPPPGVSSKLLMTSNNLSDKMQMVGIVLAVDWIKDAVSMINVMDFGARLRLKKKMTTSLKSKVN